MHTTFSLLLSISLISWNLLIPVVHAVPFNVTAIGTEDMRSKLQCWQMETPFITSSDHESAGCTVASLGSAANVSYAVIPPKFDNGLHFAPANQWVAFMSGVAYITVPDDPLSGAYVQGGEFGLIFASDTKDVSDLGHRTQYLGTAEAVLVAIPTVDGRIPEHEIVHEGPCSSDEIMGVRGAWNLA